MSRQQTIKYLGKASHLTIQDIPKEYRDHTKILAFVSAFSSYQEEEKILVSIKDPRGIIRTVNRM